MTHIAGRVALTVCHCSASSAASKRPRRALLESSGTHRTLNPEPSLPFPVPRSPFNHLTI